MSRRDIIWITLESVRQDHTSLSGNERDTTPNVRRLAARSDSAAFSNCFAHGIWTRTSSASMLTGSAPASHGVLSFDSKLPADIKTVPEQLSDRGYRTAAVSPIAQVSEATGLDRGFDDFHYLTRGTLLEEAGLRSMVRYLRQIRHHSAGLTMDTKKHSIGYLVAEIATRHIRQRADEDDPLFLYVHIGDSHHPYYPPKGWREAFVDDLQLDLAASLSVAMEMSDRLIEQMAAGLPFSDAEWNAIEVLYDTAIRYVDSLAGTIVDTARSYLDDPIVVVTADHGELLGEEGCLAHMLVANTAVTNVPLVISGLEGLDGGDRLVQPADVLKTISNRCELSLSVPAGQDVSAGERAVAVTQRGGKRARKKIDQIRDHDPESGSHFCPGNLTSVRTADYRYQRCNGQEDLFVLPDETVDRAESEPAITERFRQVTDEWLAEHAREESTDRAEFSAQMRRQLEDLGYF